MTKNEFISELKVALTDELPQNEIDNNIVYYDSYIREQMSNETEDAVLDKLGEPRLIAKTIIETYQLSHDHLYNMKHHADYEEGFTEDWREERGTQEAYQETHTEDREYGDGNSSYNMYGNYHIKWYHKLLLGVVLAFILVAVIFIGGIILRLFFTIGVPILFIYLIYRLIVNNRRH